MEANVKVKQLRQSKLEALEKEEAIKIYIYVAEPK